MRSLAQGHKRAQLFAVLTALVAVLGLSGTLAAPAQAAIGNCVSASGSKVCFDPVGEHLYVYDTAGDGMAATAYYRGTYDSGWTRLENNGGSGSELDKNLDMPENTFICYIATTTNNDVIIYRSSPSGWISAADGAKGANCPAFP